MNAEMIIRINDALGPRKVDCNKEKRFITSQTWYNLDVHSKSKQRI